MLAVVFYGCSAGVFHALTGPDHMAVLLPSCIGRPSSKAWITGARWGLGHGLGATAFGALAISLKRLLNVDMTAASHWLELILVFTLFAIGINGIRETCSIDKMASNRYVDDVELLKRSRSGDIEMNSASLKSDSLYGSPVVSLRDHHEQHQINAELSFRAAVGTGIIHGFTGTGHLVGIMPALGMSTVTNATLYLCGFLSGTLVAMAIFTAVIGHLSLTLRRVIGPGILLHVTRIASAFAIVMGIWLLIYWLTK